MNPWNTSELAALGRAEEVDVTVARPDGTLRPWVTIWGVRVGDSFYIRSAHGPNNGWYRRAVAAGTGRLRTSGLDTAVTFGVVTEPVHEAIDAAYHAKYDRYGPRIVGSVVGPAAVDVTLEVSPSP